MDIKYRIYDKINNRMFYWTKEFQEYDLKVALLVSKRFIVMQYIGRQDINNKDIYEGDFTNHGVVEYNTKLNWDGGGSIHPGFYFKESYDCLGNETELSYHTGFDDCEVLGNIYENPELLEKK